MTSQSFPALFYIINHWNAFQTKYCISATLYEVYIFFDVAVKSGKTIWDIGSFVDTFEFAFFTILL